MKHSLKIAWFAIALVCILTCGMGLAAFADAYSASLDFAQTGSISLTLEDDDGNVMSDGAVSIYQVATLYLDDGNMAYAYTEDFSNFTEILDVEDVSLVAILEEYIKENSITGVAADIGADGTVSFGDLELGLYLVVQTTQSTGFSIISPFLVTVPFAENDTWVYDVDASPKVEVSAAPATPTPTPTSTPTTTPTDTPTPTPSETPTETPTSTTTSTPVSPITPTETPTDTSSETPTSSSTPTPISPVTPTESSTPTETPTETITTTATPTPTASATPVTSTSDTTLPQTGQLIWPVPMLAIAGLVLFAIGWVIVVSDRKKDNKA